MAQKSTFRKGHAWLYRLVKIRRPTVAFAFILGGKKMKSRKLLSLLLILALAISMSLAFTSCGDTDDDDTSFMDEEPETPNDNNSNQETGFKYSVNSDGTYTVSKFVFDGSDENPVIEAEYEKAAVTAIGARAFENLAIKSIVIPEGVKVIGDYAFAGCTGLTEIVIPASVTTIGSHAFYGCSNITNIEIKFYEEDGKYSEDNVSLSIGEYAFAGCSSLCGAGDADSGYTLTISERVASIGKAAFFGCNKITALSLSDNLVSIGESAFQSCTGLTAIQSGAGSKLVSIGANAFRECSGMSALTIPASVETIGHDAFRDCTSLSELNVNAALESVGSYAFYGSAIATVNAPDVASWVKISFADTYANPISGGAAKLYVGGALVQDVNTGSACVVGSYSFYNYPYLKSITITDSVKSIGRCAFYSTGISSVIIADGIESIGDYAFSECRSLTSLVIGKGVKTISRAAFANCAALNSIVFNAKKMNDLAANNMVFANVGSDLAITFSSDATYVPAYLLCSAEDSAKLPKVASISFAQDSSCKGIGEAAFKNASAVSAILLPDAIQTIGASAFANCSALTSITIGENVKSLGNGAFAGCAGVNEINFNATAMNDLAPLNGVFANLGAVATLNVGANVERIPANLLYSSSFAASRPVIAAYSFNLVEGESALKSIGESAFKFATATTISLPDSLLVIEKDAFAGSSLVAISIPDSVTSVGAGAFASCPALASVSFGAGLTEIAPDFFYGSTAITELTVSSDNAKYYAEGNCVINTASRTLVLGCSASVIPADLITGSDDYKVIAIGDKAFYGCTGLTSIVIPASVTSIGNQAFASSGITAIAIPDGVSAIGDSAFANCSSAISLSIGKAISYIDPLWFYGCTALESISVSEENASLVSVANSVLNKGMSTLYLGCKSSDLSVSELATLSAIGDNAFAGCIGLSAITIPASVSTIGNKAFFGCESLVAIEIPDGVFMLGTESFAGCKSLETIAIGSGVSEIPEGTFTGCTSIVSITVSEFNGSVAVINGCLINVYSGIIVTACQEFDITSDMMNGDNLIYPTIGSGAFAGRTDITSLVINSNYIGIGASAFEGCVNLTSIKLPASIGTLGDDAFKGCSSLEIYFDVEEPYESWGNYNPDNCPVHFKSAE